ncbi:MAG: LacI family DNA-binding transcriptional regulator [Victivallaceae bacterium]|nr:LacI family DNA-binding transcriptional regulator [Victivallaceae bacterium]
MKEVTMDDVARLSGCSKSTVSYCISGRRAISEHTRKRVLDAMEFLHYRPSRENRREQHRPTIMILINDMFRSFLSPQLKAVVKEVFDQEYLPSLHPLPNNTEALQALLNSVGATREVAGILNMASAIESFDLYKWSGGVPSIIFIRNSSSLSPIQFEYAQCMRLILRHLVGQMGHRKLVFVTEKESVERKSVLGYRKELENFADQCESRMILLPLHMTSLDLPQLHTQLETAYQEGFRAFVTLNAYYASQIYRYAAERQWNIPKDLSVATIEDSELYDWFIPPLAKIKMPSREIAQETVAALIAQIEMKDPPVFSHFHATFLPGGSTAPPPEETSSPFDGKRTDKA